MKTQQHSKKKPEVYSISGFRDTLASPIFYPVIVVAVVLGITSIFGFVQNPLKLKSVVNVIQQKVATQNVVNDSFEDKQRYVISNHKLFNDLAENSQATPAIELFSDFEVNPSDKMPIAEDFERIAFNYDVTSESFWTDLDSTQLETAAEKMQREQKEASTFGAPLRLNDEEQLPAEFNSQNDSIYAINSIN